MDLLPIYFSIPSLLIMLPVFCVHFGILRQMVCLKPIVTFNVWNKSKHHYKTFKEWPQNQRHYSCVLRLFSYCCCLMRRLDMYIHTSANLHHRSTRGVDNRPMWPKPYIVWINTNSPVSRKLDGSRGTSNNVNFHNSVLTTGTFWSFAGESKVGVCSDTSYQLQYYTHVHVVCAASCVSLYIHRISIMALSLLCMVPSCKVSLMLD